MVDVEFQPLGVVLGYEDLIKIHHFFALIVEYKDVL
jgi:hypothetical protein